MSAGRLRCYRGPPLLRRPRPRLPSGRPRGLLPSHWRPGLGREAVSILGGIVRRSRSGLYLRFDEAQHGIDGIARGPPFRYASREGTLPVGGETVVLSRRPPITGRAVCVEKTVPLQAAKQRVDGPLADDRETAATQPLRHLIAVGRFFLHHGQKAKVENSAKQLAASPLATCHASHDSTTALHRKPEAGEQRLSWVSVRKCPPSGSSHGPREARLAQRARCEVAKNARPARPE